MSRGPASGMPASGIPAGGHGWGGPAKGASTSRIKPGDPDGITKGAYAGRIRREALRLLLAGDIPAVAETWRAIMNDEKQPAMARIIAAEKIKEEVLGKVPTVTVTSDAGPMDSLTDAELDRGIDELRQRLAGAAGDGADETPH